MNFSELAQKSVNPKRLVQPFLKVIRRNETILAREVGQLALGLREAKSICHKIDTALAELQKDELHYYRQTTPGSSFAGSDPNNTKTIEKIWSALRSIRTELAESLDNLMVDLSHSNKGLAPHGPAPTAESSSPLIINRPAAFAEAHVAAFYEEMTDEDVAPEVKEDFYDAVNDLAHSLREKSAADGGWKALLFNHEGTIDMDFELGRHSDAEKVCILAEQVRFLTMQQDSLRSALQAEIDEAKAARAMVDRECDALKFDMAMLKLEYGEKGIGHDFAVYRRVKAGILNKSLANEPICANEIILNPSDFHELEDIVIRATHSLLDLCRPQSLAPSGPGIDAAPDMRLDPYTLEMFYSAKELLVGVHGISDGASLQNANTGETPQRTQHRARSAGTTSRPPLTRDTTPIDAHLSGERISSPASPSRPTSPSRVNQTPSSAPAPAIAIPRLTKNKGQQPSNDWKAIEKNKRVQRAMELYQQQKDATKRSDAIELRIEPSSASSLNLAQLNVIAQGEAGRAEQSAQWQQWPNAKTQILVHRLKHACARITERVLFTHARDEAQGGHALGSSHNNAEYDGFAPSFDELAIGESGIESLDVDANHNRVNQRSSSSRVSSTPGRAGPGCYDALNAHITSSLSNAETDAAFFARKINSKINKHIMLAKEMEALLAQMKPDMTPLEVISLSKRYSAPRTLAPVSYPRSTLSSDRGVLVAIDRPFSSPDLEGRRSLSHTARIPSPEKTMSHYEDLPRLSTPPLHQLNPSSKVDGTRHEHASMNGNSALSLGFEEAGFMDSMVSSHDSLSEDGAIIEIPDCSPADLLLHEEADLNVGDVALAPLLLRPNYEASQGEARGKDADQYMDEIESDYESKVVEPEAPLGWIDNDTADRSLLAADFYVAPEADDATAMTGRYPLDSLPAFKPPALTPQPPTMVIFK